MEPCMNKKDLQSIVDRWQDELGVYDDKMTMFAQKVAAAVANSCCQSIKTLLVSKAQDADEVGWNHGLRSSISIIEKTRDELIGKSDAEKKP